MFPYTLHDALTNLRERRKLKQKVVALRCGVKPCDYNRWETGERRPSDKRRPALCRALECTEFDLWNEQVRLQYEYYCQQAVRKGEPPPTSDYAPLAREIEKLFVPDHDPLPPKFQDSVDGIRDLIATLLAVVMPLTSQHVGLRRALQNLELEDSAAEEEAALERSLAG